MRIPKFFSESGLAAGLLCAALLASLTPAFAEKRVALVVGINNYPNLKDGSLTRAVADAETMAEVLRGLNFDVEIARNVSQSDFLAAIDRVKSKIDKDDTVFVFYAGHGVGLRGSNLLLPSDIPAVGPESELVLRGKSVSETDIIDAIRDKGPKLVILTLDACRNNPIEEFAREQARARGQVFRSTPTMRQIGLEVRPTGGVFSIYSAGFGQRALDRLSSDAAGERNSVFTRVFAKNLRNADGRNLPAIVEDVRDEVASLAQREIDPETGRPHLQSPAYYNETTGGRIFLAGLPGNQPIRPQPPAPQPAVPQQQTPPEPPRKQEASLPPAGSVWNHNNSTMSVRISGDSITISYLRPRQGMIDEGVHSGTVLFQGQISGTRISGTSNVFDRRCGIIPYNDDGEIFGNRKIVLNGRRVPNQLTSDCGVAAYRSDASIFDRAD